jgi:hypothetical protein
VFGDEEERRLKEKKWQIMDQSGFDGHYELVPAQIGSITCRFRSSCADSTVFIIMTSLMQTRSFPNQTGPLSGEKGTENLRNMVAESPVHICASLCKEKLQGILILDRSIVMQWLGNFA